MGHRFTYVVLPEEERENLTVEWFLRRHGYSRHIITGLKRTEDGIFRNGVRAWTSQAVHAGDVIETHLVETEPSDGILPRPVPFSVVYEDVCIRSTVICSLLMVILAFCSIGSPFSIVY